MQRKGVPKRVCRKILLVFQWTACRAARGLVLVWNRSDVICYDSVSMLAKQIAADSREHLQFFKSAWPSDFHAMIGPELFVKGYVLPTVFQKIAQPIQAPLGSLLRRPLLGVFQPLPITKDIHARDLKQSGSNDSTNAGRYFHEAKSPVATIARTAVAKTSETVVE